MLSVHARMCGCVSLLLVLHETVVCSWHCSSCPWTLVWPRPLTWQVWTGLTMAWTGCKMPLMTVMATCLTLTVTGSGLRTAHPLVLPMYSSGWCCSLWGREQLITWSVAAMWVMAQYIWFMWRNVRSECLPVCAGLFSVLLHCSVSNSVVKFASNSAVSWYVAHCVSSYFYWSSLFGVQSFCVVVDTAWWGCRCNVVYSWHVFCYLSTSSSTTACLSFVIRTPMNNVGEVLFTVIRIML